MTCFPRRRRLAAREIALAALGCYALAGCGASPPVRYHTLSAPPTAEKTISGSARALVELLPIAIPERLNRQEMVLGGNGSGPGLVEVADTQRWAGNPADEIRQVLTSVLWSRLRAIDVYQAPPPAAAGNPPRFRVSLRIERFDAAPGREAVVEGAWTSRRILSEANLKAGVPNDPPAVCRAAIAVALPAVANAAAGTTNDSTADQATAALSKATATLAGLIADSLDRQQQGLVDACPTMSP